MFDALEINWKDTQQANLINELYQGKLKDYVKCLEVRIKYTYSLFYQWKICCGQLQSKRL